MGGTEGGKEGGVGGGGSKVMVGEGNTVYIELHFRRQAGSEGQGRSAGE